MLTALLVFKLTLVPRNDLVEQVIGGHAAGRVFEASRWLEIARGLGIASWSLGPPMLAALLAVFCCHRRERLRLPLVVAAAMLLAYLAIYLCTSQNLSWHLATSLQRLLLQLLPLVVFGVCSGRPRAGS